MLTERAIRVCPALLIGAHAEYRLFYLPTDIISFARALGMDMEVVLGSRANVCELMKMLEIIESTRLEHLRDAWRDRTFRRDDHHPRRVWEGGEFIY